MSEIPHPDDLVAAARGNLVYKAGNCNFVHKTIYCERRRDHPGLHMIVRPDGYVIWFNDKGEQVGVSVEHKDEP